MILSGIPDMILSGTHCTCISVKYSSSSATPTSSSVQVYIIPTATNPVYESAVKNLFI